MVLPKIKLNRQNLALIGVSIILVAIPLTVILLGIRQELRKRAVEAQGSILINNGAETTNSRNVTLTLTAPSNLQSLLKPSHRPFKIPQAFAQTVQKMEYCDEGADRGGGFYEDWYQAETFTPETDYTVTSVRLKLWRISYIAKNPEGKNATIGIKATDGTKPIGNYLTSRTLAISDVTTEYPGGWVEIDLPDYSVSTGTTYAVYAECPNCYSKTVKIEEGIYADAEYLNWMEDTGGPKGGTCDRMHRCTHWSTSQSTLPGEWQCKPDSGSYSYDFLLEVWGTTGGSSPTPTPTPTSTPSPTPTPTPTSPPEEILMMISNYEDFRDASPEPFSSMRSWTLTEGDGLKTVWAKFEVNGVWTDPVFDTIILDTSEPGVTLDLVKVWFKQQEKALGRGHEGAVLLYLKQGGSIVSEKAVQFDENGEARDVELLGVTAGTYDAFIYEPGYLIKKLTNVEIGESGNSLDFTKGETEYFLVGDFNGDQVVNILDFSIFVESYDKSGEE